MKKLALLLILSAVIFSFALSPNKNIYSPYKGSCSTFLMKQGLNLIAGHNLDDSYQVSGTVIINKRNVFKKGITWKELSTSEKETSLKPEWTSNWGSVSFNTRGRDFADGGMNEKGLVIWEMTLRGTKFIQDESKPKLFMMQWMQYQLDNHENVQQVITSASDIMLDGWQWHFFTADREGNCASIEFINGNIIIHAGDDMPVKVLCNAPYSSELKTLEIYEGFGGKRPITMVKGKQPRFVHAVKMINDYNPTVSGNIVNYGFDILDQLDSVGYNQWQIIVDMKNLNVYIRTNQSREIRHFNLNSFNLSCDAPVKMIDIHADLSGNITNEFVEYTFEQNKKYVKMDIEGIIKDNPSFEQRLVTNGISKDILIDRLARYSENTVCKK